MTFPSNCVRLLLRNILELQMSGVVKWMLIVDWAAELFAKVKCNNFGDPSTSPAAPSSGQNVLINTTYDQKLASLMTFPFVSAVLCF